MANKVGAFEAPATAFTGYTPPTPALIRGSKAAWSPHEFSGGAAEMAKATNVASWNQVFLNAFSSGVTNFYVQDGVYPFRDVIGPNLHPTEIIRDGSYRISCGPGAQFVTGAELAGETGALLRFAGDTAPTSSDTVINDFVWEGGTFKSELTTGAGFGTTFLDLVYLRPCLRNVRFLGGLGTRDGSNSVGVGYMDSAFVTHQCLPGLYEGLYCEGFYDTAGYLNGSGVSVGDAIGRVGNDIVQGCFFYRCNKAINTKRSHVGLWYLYNTTLECGHGAFSSAVTVTENRGYRFKVIGNVFKGIEGYPIYGASGRSLVSLNQIEDWSHSLYDGSIKYPSSLEAPHAAVRLDGSPSSVICDNQVSMVDWSGKDWSSVIPRAPCFLALRVLDNDDIADVATDRVVAHHNRVQDVYRVFFERSGNEHNTFENREMCTGEIYPDSIDSPDTLILYDGSPQLRLLDQTANLTVDIPPNCVIERIAIANTTANAVTGGMKIGTTSGGTEVVAAQAVGADALLEIDEDSILLKGPFSRTANTTLWVRPVTAWNSASLDITFVLRKVFA